MSEAYIRKGLENTFENALEIVLSGILSHDEEFTTMHECSSKCRKLTTMFAYGTNDFGRKGCKDGLCKCQCIYDKEKIHIGNYVSWSLLTHFSNGKERK